MDAPSNLVKAFYERADLTPEALALSGSGQNFTYAELDVRSNQLAHRLRALGVGPETPVGLMLRRSPAAAVSALAILKAGGAYVPLDPGGPAERMSLILGDAGIRVVITAADVPLPAGVQRVHLDADAVRIAAEPRTRPDALPVSESLAYIMYTSGSTGRPKGVLIAHAAVSNLIAWHNEAFAVTPADRASQIANLAFDAAVWELWPYLAAGASVHFPEDAIRTEPEALRDWLLAQRITVSFVPTVLAEYLIGLEWPAAAPLRYLLTGADTLQRFPRRNLPFTLINNYGPTECTVVSTSGAVPAGCDAEDLPSIGWPIRDAQVHILDDHLRPVPDGALGEIFIGGAGLARGYLNLPDLTAEKFVRDPFGHDRAARLYRTGDLGKFLPDGRIAFAGRTDDQVKIRGYRIEPGEIGTALNRHPAVSASVVQACPDASGEKQLVAYLTAVNGTRPADSTIREYLASQLPAYMIPSEYVWLDRFPLNISGKIDRAALPKPRLASPVAQPTAEVEDRVLEILRDLLKVSEIGRDDNFFMLGGHSLLGAQVIVKIREVFGIELTLRNLFTAPTVNSLAAAIRSKPAVRHAGASK